MSKIDRRRQLLEVAGRVARRDGTDALTLAAVAEQADVTRPVVYEHFGTRAGLLIALYSEIADLQYEQAQQALESHPGDDLAGLADRVGSAFMHCYLTTGPEAYAIAATLKGDTRMEHVHAALMARYVDAYRDAFAPHCTLDTAALRVRLVAVVAAGEALSELMLNGTVDEAEAARTLTSLMIAWLPARPAPSRRARSGSRQDA